MSGKVFISYARPTLARARQVADALSAQGYEVWIDDQLLAHRPFADSIEEALSAADAAIVLWSGAAIRSDWVRSEANKAREAGKLVQLRLEGCTLPMPFDQIHCIDIAEWRGEPELACWRAVLSSLGAVAAGQAGAAAPSRTAAGPLHPAVPRRRPGLERRRVAALCCAIADWTRLAAEDPEDILPIAEAFRAALGRSVGRHGGTVVERTDGDALAYFGLDAAGEEDGANAVRAALALRDAMDGQAIACGIATALCVVKPDEVGATAVVGQAASQARTLAAAARPGAILADRTTQRACAGMFAFRELVADRPGPLASEVLAAAAVASRSQARTGAARMPLIGREAEHRRLRQCWEAATAGMGQVALLTGEAGIGKSTLVAAFRAGLSPEGVRIALHCGPSLSGSALSPVREALIQAIGIDRSDPPEQRRAELCAYAEHIGLGDAGAIERLAELIGAAPQAESGVHTPEQRRALTMTAVLRLLEALTRDRPGLFVIEDLHWADPTTLELLARAVDGAPDHRWMILGTARPEFLCDWSDHADVELIALERLDHGAMGEICRRLDPDQRLSGATVHAIIARAEGNPLFVQEITRFVLAEAEDDAALSTLAVPDTLHDLLVARLDRLGPAREVARIGAVLGARFGYELIAAVSADAFTPVELRAALRELAKQGVLEVTGTPPRSRYGFSHALLCDAAYETVPKREREALHTRIAAALREQFADLAADDPTLLAHHLTRSGQVAEAIPLWALAGQGAAAKAAHAEAARAFATALELLRTAPRDAAGAGLELQLLLGLAVSLAATHGYCAEEVGRVLGEARALCDAIGNEESLFVVLRGLVAFTLVRGELAAGEALARRCLEIADKTGLPVHRIEGLCSLGYMLWAKGDLAEGPALMERMVALYEEQDGAALPRLTTMDPLVTVLGPLGLARLALGEERGLKRVLDRLDRLSEQAPDGFSRVFAAYWRAILVQPGGNPAASLAAAERAAALAESAGYVQMAALLAVARARMMAQAGDPAGGLALAAPALATLRKIGHRHGIPMVASFVGWLHGLNGDAAAGLRLSDEAIAMADEMGEYYWAAPLLLDRATLLGMTGDEAGAYAARGEARAAAQRQGALGFLAWIDAAAPAMA